MQCQVMYQACDGFYFIPQKQSKLSQKTDFLTHFERFFVYAPLRPLSYAQILCQIKLFIEVHNRGKFHHYTICGFQVINFQMLS